MLRYTYTVLFIIGLLSGQSGCETIQGPTHESHETTTTTTTSNPEIIVE